MLFSLDVQSHPDLRYQKILETYLPRGHLCLDQSHETTAAVRSYISTVSRNSSAAAVFLRLHTLAVTLATADVRRIFNF